MENVKVVVVVVVGGGGVLFTETQMIMKSVRDKNQKSMRYGIWFHIKLHEFSSTTVNIQFCRGYFFRSNRIKYALFKHTYRTRYWGVGG